jgi:aminoglycoside phosphotransferase (APT) family kinase protein
MIPAQALAAVPGSGAGAAPRITPLPGGLVNRAFRIETAAGVFVLRLNAPARLSALLGVDRRAEVEAQRLAGAAGLAPRVIAVGPDHAFQVCEFVAGETAGARTLASPSGMARLGATLQALRTLAAPVHLRGTDLLARTRRLVALAAAREPGAVPALHAALAAAEAGWLVAGQGRQPCLVHSDPNPGNVVLAAGAGPAVLLDWEYAHVGDPLQDPAAWLQACPALRGREAELLRACGLENEADAAMLAGQSAVYAALGLAWSRLVETAAGVAHDGRAN